MQCCLVYGLVATVSGHTALNGIICVLSSFWKQVYEVALWDCRSGGTGHRFQASENLLYKRNGKI